MWLSLGLKLLGIKKWLSNFWSNNWKWLLPLLLFLATCGLAYWKYTSDMESAYNEGYAKAVIVTNSEWNDKIEEESARNKEFENTLRTIIEDFGQDAVKQAAERIGKERVLTEKLRTIIRDNPIYQECVVGQDVIDSRNSIRELGPQPYPIRMEINE